MSRTLRERNKSALDKPRRSSATTSPRLLTREQAAIYLGVSVPTFTALCPIQPIALGSGKRLQRFDLQRLDEWIDTLGSEGASCGKDWLAALDDGYDGGSREGA